MTVRSWRALRITATSILALFAWSTFAGAQQRAPAAGAQQRGTITGVVTDNETKRPLPGVQAHIPALKIGGLTDAGGRFVLQNVPVGRQVLRLDLIGYKSEARPVTVVQGAAQALNVSLVTSVLQVDEIVVTGVAAATPKKELPFTVAHLDIARTMSVVPSNPQQLLQGKVAGVSVIRGSGQPGEDADVVLRAPTSISGGQSPLIIVDGVITSGRLADINPQDIATIEVVKGASASSMYGSRAQAGVINIKTKRGATGIGQAHFVLRSQITANNLERPISRATHTFYKVTADGTGFADKNGNKLTDLSKRILDDGGDGSNAMRAFAVNAYPTAYPARDAVAQFFKPGNQYNTYAAIEGSQGAMNYRISGNLGHEDGIIQYRNGSKSQNVRVNVDHKPLPNLQLSFSGYYAHVDQDLIGQGGNGGVLQSLLTTEPMYNLDERDADGNLKPGVGPTGAVVSNILYTLANTQDTRKRNRVMGGLEARYAPLPWFTMEGNVSYDRSSVRERHYLPKGFKRIDVSGASLPDDVGSLSLADTASEEVNASVTGSLTHNFGNFTSRTQLRYLVERHDLDFLGAGGNGFSVVGVPTLGLLAGASQMSSFFNRTDAMGLFAISSLGYKSKYLIDALGRRDGSSLFGSNQRWQNYYRVSAAWRATQEPWWPIKAITEFKPRISQGTAGGRPRYEAQYQTYTVDRGLISPALLGNPDLKPEYAKEREIGLDITFKQRVTANVNYVSSVVEDQLLLTPLPGFYGFTSQWRNAGTLSGHSIDATLDVALVDRRNFVWTSNVNLNTVRQRITRLDVPNFQIRYYRSTMYVVKGEPLGVYYGKKWAKQCGDLVSGTNCADFDVNDDGYLVYVGQGNTWKDGVAKKLWGTTGQSAGKFYDWGRPLAAQPWPQVSKMGQSLPNFALSWGNSVRWKGLSANVLFQGEFGPKVYSGTLQWEANNPISNAVYDQANKSPETWKPQGYYFTFYDVNINNDHWVYDASYVKLRELSLRYTFNKLQLSRFFRGNFTPEQMTVNLVGRNLKTWTKYPGYDPEVGNGNFLGSAVVGRIDELNYPNLRNFGVDVEITF